MRVSPLLSLFLLLFFSSCGKDYIYKEYIELDVSGWTYDKPVVFNFEIKDTSKVYDLLLDVEHLDTFAFENAYVKVLTTFPDGKVTEQQLSLELAAKNGKWNGNCSSGKCDLLIGLQQGAIFAGTGKYKVSFEQYGRNPVLKGILKLGFLVEDAKKQKSNLSKTEKKGRGQPMPLKNH